MVNGTLGRTGTGFGPYTPERSREPAVRSTNPSCERHRPMDLGKRDFARQKQSGSIGPACTTTRSLLIASLGHRQRLFRSRSECSGLGQAGVVAA